MKKVRAEFRIHYTYRLASGKNTGGERYYSESEEMQNTEQALSYFLEEFGRPVDEVLIVHNTHYLAESE